MNRRCMDNLAVILLNKLYIYNKILNHIYYLYVLNYPYPIPCNI